MTLNDLIKPHEGRDPGLSCLFTFMPLAPGLLLGAQYALVLCMGDTHEGVTSDSSPSALRDVFIG